MLTVEYVKNLQWEDEQHTLFSCVVKYRQFDEELPSGVNGIDKAPHIKEIWEKANAGEYGEINEYIPPPEPEPSNQSIEQPTVQGAQTL